MSGRSRIDIKYISDDKKRSDTFYKRRKGLIKKAHELSIICGMKIALICTDFDKTCFTYCNDPSLGFDLENIFKEVDKPIWLNTFNQEDGKLKKKIVFGRRFESPSMTEQAEKQCADFDAKEVSLEPIESADHLRGTLCGDQKSCILRKRQLPEQSMTIFGDGDKTDIQNPESILSIPSSKKLKKDVSCQKTTGSCLKTGYGRGPSCPSQKLDQSQEEISCQKMEECFVFNFRRIINDIKLNTVLAKKCLRIDPASFQKLNNFLQFVNEKLATSERFLDHIILRNMICCYFNQSETPAPLHKLKTIPMKQILILLDKIQSIDVQKVNEVFLRVLFDKLNPNKYFKLLEEIQKVDLTLKLEAFKKVHKRRLSDGKSYIRANSKRLKAQIRSLKDLETPIGLLTNKFTQNFHNSLVVLHDKWFIMTMKEIVSMTQMAKIADEFFESLPKVDFKKLACIIARGGTGKSLFEHGGESGGNGGQVEDNRKARTGIESFIDLLTEKKGGGGDRDCDTFSFMSDFSQVDFRNDTSKDILEFFN